MKKRDLLKEAKKYGWYFLRNGGSHDLWTNGDIKEPVPRHREIEEKLAKKILQKIKKNRVKK